MDLITVRQAPNPEKIRAVFLNYSDAYDFVSSPFCEVDCFVHVEHLPEDCKVCCYGNGSAPTKTCRLCMAARAVMRYNNNENNENKENEK